VTFVQHVVNSLMLQCPDTPDTHVQETYRGEIQVRIWPSQSRDHIDICVSIFLNFLRILKFAACFRRNTWYTLKKTCPITSTKNLHRYTWPKLCGLIGRLCLKVYGTSFLSVCHPFYASFCLHKRFCAGIKLHYVRCEKKTCTGKRVRQASFSCTLICTGFL